MPSIPPERRERPVMLYFPPAPPPLDAVFARTAITGRGAVPEGLNEYAAEIFYPQISGHFATTGLPEKLRRRVAEYRVARSVLLKQLQDALATAPNDDATQRRQYLETFSRQQTARLVELERDAEQLRKDLLLPSREWSALREWKLGERAPRGFSPLEVAQVMRGYAFYRSNLSVEQRSLLREVAIELSQAADSAAAATSTERPLFFSPALTRVALPADLPPEVAAKIATFQTKKSALKKGLFDAVYAHEKSFLTFLNDPLKQAVAQQPAQLAELEKLAEEIRVGLAHLARSPGATVRSPVPMPLVARLGDLALRGARLMKEANARIAPVVARVRQGTTLLSVNYAFESSGLRFAVVPRSPNPSPELARQAEVLRTEFKAIADDYGRSLAALINDREEIRREAAEHLQETNPVAVDAALTRGLVAATQQANANAYRDYRTAVFEPGLSLEQRRLLVAGSIEKLDLPLPRGEMQPTQLSPNW